MPSNQLLNHLPATERQRLLRHGKQVPLHEGARLVAQDQPLRALLFPLQGFVCLVTPLDAHPPVQLGMVGPEGVLGAQALLGALTSPVSFHVQERGQAWRLTTDELRRALPLNPGLGRLLARYALVQLRHACTEAACLHFHPLQARLARWLLMGDDRTEADRLAVTHECLAQLLGVRRAGVTVAAGALQHAGLIRYQRGWITICDRPGLQNLACSCYVKDSETYFLGMRFPPHAGFSPTAQALTQRTGRRPQQPTCREP